MDWEFDKTNKENTMPNLDAKASPIMQELVDLKAALDVIDTLTLSLLSRLDPVLSPNNIGQDDSNQAPVPQRSTMADGLRDRVEQVNLMTDRLTAILRRLEL